VKHLFKEEFKPVIFLKRRWLVLSILTGLIFIMFTTVYINSSSTAAAAESAVKSDPQNEELITSYYSGRRMVPIYKVSRTDNKISITIDGAWGSGKTEEILALLRKYNVKVSFFFAGRWIENNQELVLKILDNGHNIYNHSYSHPHFNSLSRNEIAAELEKTEELINNLRKQHIQNIEKEADISNTVDLEYNDLLQMLENEQYKELNLLLEQEEIKQIIKKSKAEHKAVIFDNDFIIEAEDLYLLTNMENYNLKIDLFIEENNINQQKAELKQGKDQSMESPDLPKDSGNLLQQNEQNREAEKLFRPPYGEYNSQVIKTARELGYQVVQWSLDSHDWMDPGEKYIIDRIINNVDSGDILLFHNNSADITAVLEKLIPYLKQRYEITPVENLIYKSDYIIRSYDGLQYSIKDDKDEN